VSRRILLGCLLICVVTFNINAQDSCNLRLFGRVSDHHDGSNLAYTNLLLESAASNRIGVSADEQGRYEVDGLCPGNYSVIVSHIGCEPDTFFLTLKASRRVEFKLEHHLEELEEVEVSAQLEDAAVSESKLSEAMLRQTEGDDLAERLKRINGVNSYRTGSNISKPMIGGFTSNRIQIINSGVEHQNQNWGDEHAPEINPFQHVNYKVVRGANAVKYGGGALGGFVLVEPKPLKREPGIDGKISSLYASNNRMYASALMLEGNSKFIPQLSWRAEGSFRRAGNIRSPNYYQDNTGLNDQSISWNLAWFEDTWKAEVFYSLYKSELGIFSGAHIGNLTDLRQAIAQERPREIDTEGFSYTIDRPYQLITHELVKGEFSRYFDRSSLKFTLSRQFNIREEFDKERPRNKEIAALDIPEFSLSLESYQLRANYELDRGDLHYELGGGLGNRENSVNSFVDFIPDFNSLDANAFGIVNLKQGNYLFSAAARLDLTRYEVNKLLNREFTQFEHEYSAFTLSTGASRNLSDQDRISLKLNLAERAPAINELYSEGLHHGTASLEFGDNQLAKERSYNARLVYAKQTAKFDAEIQAYGQYIQDFIYLEPNGFDLTIRGAFPTFDWQNTDALLRGIDLNVRLRPASDWELSHQSSWLWANQLNSDENDYLVNMPANRIEHQLTYRPNRENALLNHYSVWLRHQYVFRQERYDEAVEIALPPQAYQLLAIGLDKEFKFSNKITGQLGFRVENLLNNTYRDYLNRFRFYADEMGRDARINFSLNF